MLTCFRRTIGLSLASVLLVGTLPTRVEAESTVHRKLNQKIVKFAAAHLGKRVGDGACFTFPEEALKHAGANPPSRFVWGHKLAAGETVVPGDVVQFTGARIERKDGHFFVMEQHSAIVYKVHGATKFTLIHQNFGNKPSELNVTTTVIDLNDLKKGKVEIFHPQPRPGK